MKNLYLTIITIILGCILYKIISFLIYRRLTKKLKHGDLDTFTNHLGEGYEYKFLPGGMRRYKWEKSHLVIKASFDNEDRLQYEQITPFSFFNFLTEISFN